MNALQFEILNDKEDYTSIITIDDLINKLPRTLLYGYTSERNSWHVYIKDNKIHTVIYGFGERPVLLDIECSEDYVPSKRLYPECCDYKFCMLLKARGIYLPFTSPNFNREKQIYYGEIL